MREPNRQRKTCKTCHSEKDISQFSIERTGKFGVKANCKMCMNEKAKLYRLKNLQERKLADKEQYLKNKEKKKQQADKWHNENKERSKELKRINYRRKMQGDNLYRLSKVVRGRIKTAFKRKNIEKKSISIEMIGCSVEELKVYLENRFLEGMSWENYGFYGWHIDHIIPLSSATTEEDLYKLSHYSNLQPLWAKDNLRKFNKL